MAKTIMVRPSYKENFLLLPEQLVIGVLLIIILWLIPAIIVAFLSDRIDVAISSSNH